MLIDLRLRWQQWVLELEHGPAARLTFLLLLALVRLGRAHFRAAAMIAARALRWSYKAWHCALTRAHPCLLKTCASALLPSTNVTFIT